MTEQQYRHNAGGLSATGITPGAVTGTFPASLWRRAVSVRLGCLLLAAGLCLPAAGAERFPGFGLSTSRVVFMADKRTSGQVMAVNNSDNLYLVQSRVWPADGVTGYPLTASDRTPVPFLVTPPLKRLEAHGQLPLRIIATGGGALPADRESLFFLSAKAIPSQPKAAATTGPTMSMALQSFIKLYYRPAGLTPYAIYDGQVSSRLTVSRDGDQLKVNNPTPYYITFGTLDVGGKPVDVEKRRAMVPPMGSHDYPLPAGVKGGDVEWQIIDEFGLVTDKQHQALP